MRQNFFLCTMQADYIILGQGICGTLLSYTLLQAGASVVVIDAPQPFTASKVASGLMNPVTGKRYVPSWINEQLMPVAFDMYRELEVLLGAQLIKPMTVLDFFATAQQQQLFEDRITQTDYLQLTSETVWREQFNFHYGVGEVYPCYLVDLQQLLSGWRKHLQHQQLLIEDTFSWEDCTVLADKIIYNDITAQKIICCEGTAGFKNPYFSKLPFTQNKGEVLIAAIKDLPPTHIYQQGIKIVPWREDQFWIGSSFDWKFTDVQPTEAFRKQVELQLGNWLKLPYKITDHWAATRPTTVEYKPFVGLHPAYPTVGIFNGMGTKGCSLAPYFARQLTGHLLDNTEILPEAAVQRFAKVLQR